MNQRPTQTKTSTTTTSKTKTIVALSVGAAVLAAGFFAIGALSEKKGFSFFKDRQPEPKVQPFNKPASTKGKDATPGYVPGYVPGYTPGYTP